MTQALCPAFRDKASDGPAKIPAPDPSAIKGAKTQSAPRVIENTKAPVRRKTPVAEFGSAANFGPIVNDRTLYSLVKWHGEFFGDYPESDSTTPVLRHFRSSWRILETSWGDMSKARAAAGLTTVSEFCKKYGFFGNKTRPQGEWTGDQRVTYPLNEKHIKKLEAWHLEKEGRPATGDSQTPVWIRHEDIWLKADFSWQDVKKQERNNEKRMARIARVKPGSFGL